MYSLNVEADIFSGIPRDGKQNRYESRDWDGTGKHVSGSGRDRDNNATQVYTQIYLYINKLQPKLYILILNYCPISVCSPPVCFGVLVK